MTNIIELARQAGLELNWFDDNFSVLHGKLINLEQLIRADEREECAQICFESEAFEYSNIPAEIAAAISARGTT